MKSETVSFKLHYEDVPAPKPRFSQFKPNLTDLFIQHIIDPLFAHAKGNRKRPDLRNPTFTLTQYTKYSVQRLFVNTRAKRSRGKAYAGHQATLRYLVQTLINR